MSMYDPTLDEPKAPERDLPEAGNDAGIEQDRGASEDKAPDRDNLERLRGHHGHTGGLDLHSWFTGPEDVMQHETDPLVGTRSHPTNDVDDDSLQVWSAISDTPVVSQVLIPANSGNRPVQLCQRNPSRLRLGVYFTGTTLVAIGGRSANAQPWSGFVFPNANGVVWFSTISEMWVSSVDAVPAVSVYVIEEVRNSDRN